MAVFLFYFHKYMRFVTTSFSIYNLIVSKVYLYSNKYFGPTAWFNDDIVAY
jgi:hypothetical protein